MPDKESTIYRRSLLALVAWPWWSSTKSKNDPPITLRNGGVGHGPLPCYFVDKDGWTVTWERRADGLCYADDRPKVVRP